MILSTHGIVGSQITQFVGLLDLYPSAAAAYSLRKLRAAYTGSAIRVRRASDNAEQDIAFTALGGLDTSSLTSFCSGTNGFVKTWYDQSGNGRDATQATAANQPQIVSSGSVILENGKSTLQFDGSNDVLITNNITTGTSVRCEYLVASSNSAINQNTFYSYGNILGASGEYWSHTAETAIRVVGNKIWANSPHINQSLSYIEFLGVDSNSIDLFLNSNLQSSTSSNNANINTTLSELYIGNNKSTFYLNGKIQECIFYLSDQSSNRTGIETNINNFYSIY